ncbi:hypothetical protein MLD38_039764 [Melastoma candidum]|uniref:Uncharacterized protein n=1 Tax=Melastoma candidum TaxID=119954 RepID=A0ACB9L350_9MYRT|nr:hypothetical protein MLD38_039764 [Melastoma candidum]
MAPKVKSLRKKAKAGRKKAHASGSEKPASSASRTPPPSSPEKPISPAKDQTIAAVETLDGMPLISTDEGPSKVQVSVEDTTQKEPPIVMTVEPSVSEPSVLECSVPKASVKGSTATSDTLPVAPTAEIAASDEVVEIPPADDVPGEADTEVPTPVVTVSPDLKLKGDMGIAVVGFVSWSWDGAFRMLMLSGLAPVGEARFGVVEPDMEEGVADRQRRGEVADLEPVRSRLV